MELSMAIVTAAEKIEEQQALHQDNTINATVSAALQAQLAECKSWLVETVQDDARIAEQVADARLDGSVLAGTVVAQQDSAAEPVCVDVAAQMIFLEEVQALVNRVPLTEAAQSCIASLQQADQFFSEEFLKQSTDPLAQQINQLTPGQNDLRQQLMNQEEVFAAARQKQEGELVEAFALNNEKTLAQVVDRAATLRDSLTALQQQWSESSGAEKIDLLQQATATAATLDHYERLAWVVDTALLNQQCTDTTALLNELRPASPVVLDRDGLPLQQYGSGAIAPCYHTNEDARNAAEAEYQQRLEAATTERQRQDVSYPHVMHVKILDRNEAVMHDWWEVSEAGQPQREGHTEQKMATRIDFSVMAEQEYSLRLRGNLPPCTFTYGCDDMLEYFAQKYGVPIVYTDFDDNVYTYERDERARR
jgi:hypothetical protein